jgi:hypothetical protein
MQAYVLVQTASNTGPIARDLEVIAGVESAQDLRGPYDAIVRAGSNHRPPETILADIRKVPGVVRALCAPLVAPLHDAPRTEAA